MGDLFNLVYDPAFLVDAWERGATNTRARTPGIDRATVAMIETWIGAEALDHPVGDSWLPGLRSLFQPAARRTAVAASAVLD